MPRIDEQAVIATRIGNRIPRLFHRRDHDGADAGGIGGRRSGDTGEHHADRDIDVPQTAANTAHEGIGDVQQALGDTPVIHQPPEKQEERHRQQGKGIDARKHLVRNTTRRQSKFPDGQEGGHADGERNRHPQEDETEETHD